MSSLLVRISEVKEIKPHINSDSLMLAIVDAWQVVVRKGELNVGDLVVNFPADSVLPITLSDRLNVTKYLSRQRVKAIRLRGEYSNSLAIPISEFPEFQDKAVGENVAEILGVSKYEPPMDLSSGDMETPHPAFHLYTEIENFRNYPDLIPDDVEVIVTEKIHGCLQAGTMIRLADGTEKTIQDIVENKLAVEVLGVDENGKVVSTKITNWFNNGVTGDWKKVKFTRKRVGQGNSYGAIICTSNHQFYDTRSSGYVGCKELRSGHFILSVRGDVKLNYIQEQILLGILLGDGSICKRHIEFSKKKDHREYIDKTLALLGGIACLTVQEKLSGYGTEMLCARTIDKYYIEDFCKYWLTPQKKQVPHKIIGKLSPISLAYWFMDDGSLSHEDGQADRVSLATCGFSEKSVKRLTQALKSLGLMAVGHLTEGKFWRIRINAEDAEKFFILITPYVVPCMRYKVPMAYRGIPYIDYSNKENEYHKVQVVQTVLSVKDVASTKINKQRYDIETETHNFIANGIVVHNSNDRVGLIDVETPAAIVESVDPLVLGAPTSKTEAVWMAGSHKTRKKQEADNMKANLYWHPLSDSKVGDMLMAIKSQYKAKAVILFSEVYGWVQDLKYGCTKGQITYAAFDISVDGKYLGYEDFVKWTAQYPVKVVPIITRIKMGDLKKEGLDKYAEGNTFICRDKEEAAVPQMREGIVIKPAKEMWDPAVGRVILKYLSNEYLTRKGGTEYK